MIDKFTGKNHYLSNFHTSKIEYKGLTYQNAEAAFQAQKDPKRKEEFIDLPPNKAKALGRSVKLRSDWNKVRVIIMFEIVESKFMQNKDLQAKLLETGEKALIEGNDWGDTFWGTCNGKGMNQLGKILMLVRSDIRSTKKGDKFEK